MQNESSDALHNEVINEAKQHFLSDENYKLLKRVQQEIYEKTEVSPAMRKLVNEVITEENLKRVATKFIEIFSN